MAIDPSIALQVRPPQDMMQSLSQIYALKNAGQQQQLNQQQIQQGQYQLDAAGRAQADDAATRAAFSGNTQVDPATGAPTLNRAGALSQLYKTAPTAALKYSQQFTQQDIANQKAAADYQKTQLENAKAHVDFVGQLLQGVKDQPSYTAALQTAMQSGIVKPGEFPPVYDPSLVQQHLANALTQKDAIAAKQKELDATETARHNTTTEATAAATQNETSAYHGIESRQRGQEIGIQGARLNIEKQKQGTDQSAAIESQAQQIANGDVKSMPMSRNNPYSRAVMARVYEINPKYSDSLYTMTQALRSDKPNSLGANVGRLGTAVLHADNALRNSNDLGFSEGLLTGVGTTGTSKYKQDAEFLTGEIGQFVTGGKLTVDEGNKISKDLMSSRQSVRDSALHEILDLAGGKLKSQMQQFKNSTQTDFPTDRVFNDPTISGALRKHGIIGGSSAAGGDAGAATHVFNPATGKIEAIK